MEIQRVEYKNVYGCLSGVLDFTQGENFLVGINGCGKTTVLNLIRWVLAPSFPDLCTLEHDLIKIDIRFSKVHYSVESRIMGLKHELRVIPDSKVKKKFNPIVTSLAVEPKRAKKKDPLYIEDLKARYEHLSPEQHEVNAFRFLIELPTPVFIGLERSVDEGTTTTRLTISRKNQRKSDGMAVLGSAIGLMRDAFNSSRRRLVEINDNLNCKVLELSFSGVVSNNIKPQTKTANNRKEEIRLLKEKFSDSITQGAYSKALSEGVVRDAVIKYLDDLDSLLNKESEEDELWVMLNQHNFDRASKMLELFEIHENKAKEVQQEISNFISAVNVFIGDSGKHLHFNEDTGEPFFKPKGEGEELSLYQLSSGEAQVVILLTYFAFLAKKGKPIIIDEPELSLHVKWQKDFVNAVKKVMPDGCQTIMATHSPEICGADDVNVQLISTKGTR